MGDDHAVYLDGSVSSIGAFTGVGVLVAQSCLTLCNPTDSSPPGSSVPGILQARILEWVGIPFSRGSPRPRLSSVRVLSFILNICLLHQVYISPYYSIEFLFDFLSDFWFKKLITII